MIEVGLAEDYDVSGKVPPHKRPKLGPWLTGRSGEFDALVFTQIDRVSRSVRDFLQLVDWCKAHGKKLICASLTLDLADDTDMTAQLVGTILVWVAQLERERIEERSQKTTDWMHQAGMWRGQNPPYWCEPVELPDGHFKLANISDRVSVVKEIVRGVFARKPYEQIANALNDRGVPIPALAKKPDGKFSEVDTPWRGWDGTTIRRICTNRALIGELEYKDRITKKKTVARDADGKKVRWCEPILTPEEFAKLQSIMDVRRKAPRGGTPLSGVAKCASCSSSLYFIRNTVRGKRYEYYRCALNVKKRPQRAAKGTVSEKWCANKHVPVDWFHQWVEAEAYDTLKDLPICDPVHYPPDDNAKRLADLLDVHASIVEMIERTPSRSVREQYAPRRIALELEIAELEEAPSRPARTEWVPTGRTLGDDWAAGDMEAIGDLLRSVGVEIAASNRTAHIVFPPDYMERFHLASGGQSPA